MTASGSLDGQAYVQRADAARRGFLAQLRDAEVLQQQVLRECVRDNASSEFGRAHGFAHLSSEREFQAAVPIRKYDALAPWIDRAVAGELGVLTAAEPAVFLTSSGSTATPKVLPLTRPYVERVFLPFFFTALGNTLRYCPASIAHPDATLNLKWDPLRAQSVTERGVPKLGASQLDFARQFGQGLATEPGARASSALIPAQISDELERLYYRLRIAAEHDVRALIGINPAMVMAVPALLDRSWDRLLQELHDGTVLGERIRTPQPARARLLQELAAHHGHRLPALVWPHLELVFCWTGGATKVYREELSRAYGGKVQLLPAPLAASEAPVAVAVDRHPTAGVLFIPGAYYELADADQELSPATRTRRWNEVQVGQELHVIVSHLGGFYRYAMGDVVRVVDFVHGVPRVEYACRDRRLGLADVGLREATMVEAAVHALRASGLAARGAIATALPGAPARLAVAVELATATPIEGEDAALAEQLDHALGQGCPAYRRARQQGALAPPLVRWMARGALASDWQARVTAGVRPTQVKDRIFVDAETFDRLSAG